MALVVVTFATKPQLLQEVKKKFHLSQNAEFSLQPYLKTESLGCHTDRCTKASLILTFTAMPFRSVEAEAAVGVLLGTVLVLVSLR